MALLEFLAIAARARVVAADVFQGVAHRFLVSVAAVRTVNMAMVVIMVVVMVMIVVTVRAMDVGLLGHRVCSGIKSAGISRVGRGSHDMGLLSPLSTRFVTPLSHSWHRPKSLIQRPARAR